jgi:hypothetical protein
MVSMCLPSSQTLELEHELHMPNVIVPPIGDVGTTFLQKHSCGGIGLANNVFGCPRAQESSLRCNVIFDMYL